MKTIASLLLFGESWDTFLFVRFFGGFWQTPGQLFERDSSGFFMIALQILQADTNPFRIREINLKNITESKGTLKNLQNSIKES